MKDAKLIGVLDNEGRVVGELDSDIIHKRGLLHRAIHILVVDNSGKIFVRKRSKNKKLYPGILSSSVGAHVLAQDTEDKTAKENLKIFLGLELPLVKIGNARVEDNIENELIAIYICKSDIIPQLNSKESDEGQFLELSKIKKLIREQQTTPHLAVALQVYENYKSNF